MDILVLTLLLINFLYNYNLKKKTNYNVKKQPKYIVIIISFTILALYMSYKLYNKAYGYAIAISSAMLVYSIIFFQGIGKDLALIFLGTTPLLKLVKKEDIKDVSIKEILEKDQIRLKVKAFGDEYTQIYDVNKKDGIEKIIVNLDS